MGGRQGKVVVGRWADGALRRSVGFVALVCLPLVVDAQQVRSSVVLGGVRVRYAEALDLSAVTLAPAVTLQSRTGVLGANGTISQPSTGGWSAQGLLAGSSYRQLGRRFAAEGGANAGGSASGDGTTTGSGQVLARGHMLFDWAGAWIGAGLGSSWNGVAWQATQVGEVGAWTQWNAVGLVASWSPTAANDSVRYADMLLSVRWRGRRLELDGTLGHREGSARPTGVNDPSDWVSASASYRLSDRLAAVFGAGTYPLDLLQGFPAGRFVSFGVRLTGPGRGAAPEFARGTDEVAADRRLRTGVSATLVRRLDDQRVELRFRASGAERLEITGDLTGWAPVAMRAEPDGWWRVVLAGAPGTYEFTVRRDGGDWFVPPGMVEHRDEFGGIAGVVTLR